MKHPAPRKLAKLSLLLTLAALGVASAPAQDTAAPPPPLKLTAAQDHQAMMDQLHITTLRPGAAGTDTTSPLFANYILAKAHAKTPEPDVLTMNNGQKVTTPAQWLERRKEIFEIFDREIYGRVPELAQNLQVTWTVTSTTQGMTGDVATITRQLSGHVDNSFYPLIDVKIDASVTTPANATGRVPVIIVFGGGAPRAGAAVGARGAAGAGGARGAGAAAVAPAGPPAPPVYAIANFTTALSLTDEQAAKVSPILDAINQDQKNLTAAQSAYTSQRSASIAQINALLNPIQQPMLAQAMTPGAGFAPRGGAARGAMGAGARGAAPGGGGGGANWQQLALAKGWGFGSLNPASIQADNGAGLTTGGIIALVAKGQERKPDEWGSLRAWAWGADRLLDFFATDDKVDGKQVAFEGHSRYGKATMVTLAYDDRAATGFVSSSGEGGAKLWRRLVGEQVENLASTQEYYWMAGNFLKYAGPLTVEDLPIDAHEFIALVAPRPIFTSGGMYVDGGVPYSNELWQDAPGTFMATAGASPVYELLGKKGLSNTALNLHYSTTGDLTNVVVPPINTPLIDGDIAFRQHDQGHTDVPNWPTFIEFAGHYLHAPGAAP